MVKTFVACLLGCSIVTLTAAGQTCNTPSSLIPLVNGSTADACQVMGNFQYLQNTLAPTANPHFIGNLGIGTTTTADPPLTVGQGAAG